MVISIVRSVWSFSKMIRRLRRSSSADAQRCYLFAVACQGKFLYLYLRLSLDVSVWPFLGRRHDGRQVEVKVKVKVKVKVRRYDLMDMPTWDVRIGRKLTKATLPEC